MEVDILVSENMTELLERTRPQMDSITHEVHMATLAASSMLNNLSSLRVCAIVARNAGRFNLEFDRHIAEYKSIGV